MDRTKDLETRNEGIKYQKLSSIADVCNQFILPNVLCTWGYRLLPKTRDHRHTWLSSATGPTDAKINQRYLVRYRVDVLAYA